MELVGEQKKECCWESERTKIFVDLLRCGDDKVVCLRQRSKYIESELYVELI